MDGVPRKTLEKLEKNLEGYLSAVIMVIYTFVILLTIFSRYFTLGFAAAWVQEVVLGGFIWLAWLSVAYVMRHDDHLRFTLFRRNFSNRSQYGVYALEWIGWLIFAGVVFWFSLPILEQRIESGATITGTEFPKFLTYLAVPVGFGVILLRTIQQGVIVTRQYLAEGEIEMEEGLEDI